MDAFPDLNLKDKSYFENNFSEEICNKIAKATTDEQLDGSPAKYWSMAESLVDFTRMGLFELKRLDDHKEVQYPNTTIEFRTYEKDAEKYRKLIIEILTYLRGKIRTWKNKKPKKACAHKASYYGKILSTEDGLHLGDWALVMSDQLPFGQKMKFCTKKTEELFKEPNIPFFQDMFD